VQSLTAKLYIVHRVESRNYVRI